MQKLLLSLVSVLSILLVSTSFVNAQDPYEPPTEYCGDGTKDTGEECDDGNTTNGDGCSRLCKTETVPATGLLDNTKAELLIGSGLIMASFSIYLYGRNKKSTKVMNNKYREEFEKIVYKVVD